MWSFYRSVPTQVGRQSNKLSYYHVFLQSGQKRHVIEMSTQFIQFPLNDVFVCVCLYIYIYIYILNQTVSKKTRKSHIGSVWIEFIFAETEN